MERRTLWILGAGFSRSLGGPLLNDLLSTPSIDFARALYSDNPLFGSADTPINLVRTLFGFCGPDASSPGARIWRDAEAFLDQLDAAATDPDGPAAKRMVAAMRTAFANPNGLSKDWPNIRTTARRLVAAACTSFLRTTAPGEERWQPYQSWAGALDSTDSIVTFNYDRVLEQLGTFDVYPPHEDLTRTRGVRPWVFKLHGSVDWRRSKLGANVSHSIENDPEFALTCDGAEIGIATPGPGKRIAAQELACVWNEARSSIIAADVIVFVGYRFPPSDAEAREKLLGWIRETESPHLELHLVLGPTRSDDVVRLEQLLRYSCERGGRTEGRRASSNGYAIYDASRTMTEKTFHLTTHALYTEDFFTVWDREVLFPSWVAE